MRTMTKTGHYITLHYTSYLVYASYKKTVHWRITDYHFLDVKRVTPSVAAPCDTDLSDATVLILRSHEEQKPEFIWDLTTNF